MKLRPFSTEVHPRGRAPFLVEGGLGEDSFWVRALDREVQLAVAATAGDLLGSYALMTTGEYTLGELRVRIELRQGAGQSPLLLVIEPASAAGERAAPLFPRIGGDAALVRLIVPPAWSVKLEFGADGTLGRSGSSVTLQ